MPPPPHARQPEERSTIILRPLLADIAGKVAESNMAAVVTAKREAWDWGMRTVWRKTEERGAESEISRRTRHVRETGSHRGTNRWAQPNPNRFFSSAWVTVLPS